jgi:Flp pilus assembly protein TadG
VGERSAGEDGQSTVVITLIMATFLLGFVALGFDVNNLFRAKRMAQAAADAAAIAAAEEASDGAASQQAAANAMATLNGFNTSLATNPATVTLSTPTGGNYSGSTAYIQAVVSQPIATSFIRLLSQKSTVTVSARAVAGLQLTSPTCVCLEGTSGMDLNMSNNAKLTPTGCGTVVDSSSSNAVGVVGSSTLGGTALGIVSSSWSQSSEVNNGGSISSGTKVVTGLGTSCGPPMPTAPTYNSSKCTNDPLANYTNGGSSYSVGPGSAWSNTQGGTLVCYNSLTVGTNGDAVNLAAGTYVINGGELHFESGSGGVSNTGGSGVFFYLVNGASLVIDNGANTNLTAEASGPYSGILVFEDPGDSASLSIQGGSNTIFNGAIFAPAAGITLGNGSNTTIDAAIVAQTLTMTGGTTLASTAQVGMGALDVSVAKLTE